MAALSPAQIEETRLAMRTYTHPDGRPNAEKIADALGLASSTVKNRIKRVLAASSPDMGIVQFQQFGCGNGQTVEPPSALNKAARQFMGDQFSTYEQIHGRKETDKAGVPFQMPEGHRLKGVSALVDGEGNEVLRWVKTREDVAVEDIVSAIKEAFKDYEGTAVAAPSPAVADADLLTLVPLADWHVGLFSWQGETGTNWDLKIAEQTIGQGIDDLVARSPSSAQAIVLGGGDLLHADNQENRTARSGNSLDVDGRYQKVLMTACRLVVRTVDACLRKHKHVTVRILPGNHDEHSSVAVAYFLLAWYRNEPRVTVDVDPSLFFWFRFGKVMLGATHGHTVKIKDMAQIMAHRRAEDWGATKFRYAHGFHIHHKSVLATEGGGVISETHQTPTPQDAWHFGAGFLSGRSLKSITYHSSYGEISRSTIAILDAVSNNNLPDAIGEVA